LRDATLVLGRKGAGKTAVFKYLNENPNEFIDAGDMLISLSFEDYKWSIHSLLKNPDAAESLAFKQSWRFIILIKAVKALGSYFAKQNQPPPKPLVSCGTLLKKLFDDPIPSIYSIVGRKLLNLSRLKLPSGGLDLENGELDSIEATAGEVSFEEVKTSDSLQAHLSHNIDNVIGFIERALAALPSRPCRVFLAFDRIDEAWDPVAVETSKRVIAGLVGAAESITTKYSGMM
jgi:hypothetical protein